MNEFVLKFILPILLAIALHSFLNLHRYGWDEITYNGAYPWGLLLISLWDIFFPTASALFGAGVIKIFKRDTSFLNNWLTTFLILNVPFLD